MSMVARMGRLRAKKRGVQMRFRPSLEGGVSWEEGIWGGGRGLGWPTGWYRGLRHVW